MIIFNRKVDDKLKNTDNEDILRKMTLEIGKKILETTDGIATTVMTAYGNVIDEKLKDTMKKMILLGKVNELICKFISNEEHE